MDKQIHLVHQPTKMKTLSFQRRCFPLNILKFLRAAFSIEQHVVAASEHWITQWKRNLNQIY